MVRARGWTRYIGSKRMTYLVSIIVLCLIPPVQFSVEARNEKFKVEREHVDRV